MKILMPIANAADTAAMKNQGSIEAGLTNGAITAHRIAIHQCIVRISLSMTSAKNSVDA